MGLGTLVPRGTQCYTQKMAENSGGRYRTRTCDILGVNDPATRQFNSLAATYSGKMPTWARFVRFVFRPLVQVVP